MITKFRAWRLASGGSMHQVSSLDFNENGDLSGVNLNHSKDHCSECVLPENCVLMQSIGIIDSYGVEVFIGDIVKENNPYFYMSELERECYIYEVTEKDLPVTVSYLPKHLEVLGNKFENPELLEGAK